MSTLRNIVRLADGTIAIVKALPGQVVRVWPMIPPGDRKRILEKVGLAAFEEDSVSKAMPFIAIGIAGLVAYNIWNTRR